jgi:hypothetical protein
MQHAPPSAVLEQLDLSNPADLLIAFHHTANWPRVVPLDSEAARYPLEVLYAASPFGAPDDESTPALVARFLWELGGKRPAGRNTTAALAPRAWLAVFRAAFERDLIGPVALGAAFRFLMVQAEGNGAPGLPADSLEARRLILEDARRASPVRLMNEAERQALADMPETVTLYRGGRGHFGETTLQRARGLHWAVDRSIAMNYLGGRGYQRSQTAMQSVIRGFSAFSVPPAFAGKVANLSDELGQPFLLRASVPRALILAYIAAGVDRQAIEVFVDFGRLESAMIKDVTPDKYKWAA